MTWVGGQSERLIAVVELRFDTMVGFGKRLVVLCSATTVTALIVVLLISGLVELGIGEPWESSVIPALILLGGVPLIAHWYSINQ